MLYLVAGSNRCDISGCLREARITCTRCHRKVCSLHALHLDITEVEDSVTTLRRRKLSAVVCATCCESSVSILASSLPVSTHNSVSYVIPHGSMMHLGEELAAICSRGLHTPLNDFLSEITKAVNSRIIIED